MTVSRIRNNKGHLLEAGWQMQVVQLATLGGWTIAHMPDNRPGRRTGRPQAVVGDTAGFPDLIMLRGVEMLAVELKTNSGRLRPGQQEWLDRFDQMGQALADIIGVACGHLGIDERSAPTIESYLWRPKDVDDVVERLTGGRFVELVGAPTSGQKRDSA
ncbi:unannotated protein [freshwater metagenome]|uniref:Unannotated protein n=1 Tax=freshwater metagenome TaxID=449393 RepID=A0A6J7FMC2_9ZZZZ|nr:hypothetical protein [Actinomycetota bacterium]